MKRFLNWLSRTFSSEKPTPRNNLRQTGTHLRQTGTHGPKRSAPKQAVPKRQPEYVNFDSNVEGRIEDRGPGKNVLIRSRYVREDTGTHETLKILDESMIDTEEEEGFDPYNTGQFDRSKNWDKRRK